LSGLFNILSYPGNKLQLFHATMISKSMPFAICLKVNTDNCLQQKHVVLFPNTIVQSRYIFQINVDYKISF